MRHYASGAAGRALLAVLSGAATWLAFPPAGIWPLAVVGVAGLVLAVHGQRARRGAWLGLLFGLALFLPLLSWLSVIGPDALVLLSLLEALVLALTGAALAVVSRLRGWPVWSALLLVGGELIRAQVPFGGFPWGRLAFAMADAPYARYAAFGGVALVSVAVALSGGLVASAVLRLASRPGAGETPAEASTGSAAPARSIVAVAGALAVPLVGLVLPIGADSPGTTTEEPVRVALVQGNVPAVGLEFLGRARTVTRNHRDATTELADAVAAGDAAQPDVVIWPENSTDIDPFTDPETATVIEDAVDAIGVPILVGVILDGPNEGADVTDPEDYRRTAGVLWNPGTGPDTDQVYVKRHPVPFGEYIPLREQLLPLIGRLEQVGRQTYAGTTPGVLDLGPVTVGDVICFEIAYDSIVRDVVTGGASVLVVQTNNATYGLSAQPEQQFAISRLRAVETGRTVLVAATSGISGVIRPDGSVEQSSAKFTRDVISAEVAPQTGLTIAMRLGPWPEWVLSAGGLLALLAAIASGRRRQAPSDPTLRPVAEPPPLPVASASPGRAR